MKYRIYRHYSPMVGTWYVIQKKFLFWWRTLSLAFNDLKMANQFIEKKDKKEKVCVTPLYYNKESHEFEDMHTYETNVITIKT